MIAFVALSSLSLWAQDNTWEKPEVDETEVKKEVKDAKYLKGAVTEVDGKVVFSKTINAPGKTADQVFDIVKAYITKMTGEKNQEVARIVVDDKEKHELGATFNEWLVFKSSPIMLDQTRMLYALKVNCMRLLPLSGKFRRKTIDRKDFLFNKFESLLK